MARRNVIRIQDLIRPVLKRPCWRVRWDSQLNLDLSFGQPRIEYREPYASKAKSRRVQQLASQRLATIRAEFWLWVYVARWRITLADGRVATQRSSGRAKDLVCGELEGEKLVSVAVDPVTGRSTFKFDLGGQLDVRRLKADQDPELWTLYLPRSRTLSVRADGTYSYGHAARKVDKWHSVAPKRAT